MKKSTTLIAALVALSILSLEACQTAATKRPTARNYRPNPLNNFPIAKDSPYYDARSQDVIMSVARQGSIQYQPMGSMGTQSMGAASQQNAQRQQPALGLRDGYQQNGAMAASNQQRARRPMANQGGDNLNGWGRQEPRGNAQAIASNQNQRHDAGARMNPNANANANYAQNNQGMTRRAGGMLDRETRNEFARTNASFEVPVNQAQNGQAYAREATLSSNNMKGGNDPAMSKVNFSSNSDKGAPLTGTWSNRNTDEIINLKPVNGYVQTSGGQDQAGGYVHPLKRGKFHIDGKYTSTYECGGQSFTVVYRTNYGELFSAIFEFPNYQFGPLIFDPLQSNSSQTVFKYRGSYWVTDPASPQTIQFVNGRMLSFNNGLRLSNCINVTSVSSDKTAAKNSKKKHGKRAKRKG